MKMHRQTSVFILVMAIVTLIAGGAWAAEPWKAPAEAATVKNPVAKTKESTDRGKMLYLRYCMSCHGIGGKGDGPEAGGMDPKPGDFTDGAKMKAQTDGELFWKLTNGKGKMKPYAEVSPTHTDQEKWDLVNYIRTYAKSGKSDKAGASDPQAPREAQALLAAYLKVAAALNAGSLASAVKNAEVLGSLAGKDMMAGMTEASKAETDKLAQDLQRGAKRLQAATDLATAREAFGGVSKTVHDWLVLSQFRFRNALTVYTCPPTLAGKEVIWIQGSGPGLNPYGMRDPRRAAVLGRIPASRAAGRTPAP